MIPLYRLQTYLYDRNDNPYYTLMMVPPFVGFLHAERNGLDDNYAIVAEQPGEDLVDRIHVLSIHFQAHERVPCVFYLDGLMPSLGSALQKKGFTLEKKTSLMVCSANTYKEPEPIPELEINSLSLRSSVTAVKEMLDVEAQSGDSRATLATEMEAADFRANLVDRQAFTVRYRGQGVAAVMYDQIRDRITELRGVSTISKYRGRGIATAASAHATKVALSMGVEAVFVQINDQRAAKLFHRIGFRHMTNACMYVKKA